MKFEDSNITSVSEFLLWVKEIKESDDEINEGISFSLDADSFFYRGQSRMCWDLKPSVLRENNYEIENAFLKKATLKLWNEVSSLSTYLEKMVYFQHYGLPTRLMDLTSNPLVALYMACNDDNSYSFDGAVYCSNSRESRNDKVAELTAKYVFEYEYQKWVTNFQNYIAKEGVRIEEFTRPVFILPPINNPRIEAQNGAFVMAPLFDIVKDEGCAIVNQRGIDEMDFFNSKRAVIRANKKMAILRELSYLGIDSGSLYKDISEKIKAIVFAERLRTDIKLNL